MPKNRLVSYLHVRLEPHEKKVIEKAAKRANKSLSEWIRVTLTRAADPLLVDDASDAETMWVSPEEGKEILRLVRRGLDQVDRERTKTRGGKP